MAPQPRPRLPLAGTLLTLACAVYLLAGLIGHDPWKSDDATHLGVVANFVTDGNWLIPRIAGEAWSDSAPFYHWVAAALAKLLSPLLPLHDAGRLASALFGALFLAGLAGAARTLYGRDAGLAAPLLAMGTLGLLVPLHDAQPTTALLAAQGMSLWGLALMPARPLAGGALLGSALGAGFASAGSMLPLLVLPLILYPLRRWRDGSIWLGLGIALILALPLAAAWPAALAREHADFLAAWWIADLRQLAPRAPVDGLIDHLQLLSWFAWPLWPLAGWTFWVNRRRLGEAALALPFAALLLGLIWLVTREARPLSALPLVAPFTLLASAGADRLRRGAANAFDWFGRMTFSLLAGLIWLGAIAMLTGWPERLAQKFAKLEPGFVAQAAPIGVSAALAITLAWVAALAWLPRSPWRAATHWTLGLTTAWALLNALWLPWIDYGKTYRKVALSLRAALPSPSGCIARADVGHAQRASLDYFAGIRTLAHESPAGQACHLLLVQGSRREEQPAGWIKIWEGHRPGDKSERLRLYRRDA